MIVSMKRISETGKLHKKTLCMFTCSQPQKGDYYQPEREGTKRQREGRRRVSLSFLHMAWEGDMYGAVKKRTSMRHFTKCLFYLNSFFPSIFPLPSIRPTFPPTDWPEPTKEKLTLTFPPLMMQA